MRRANIHRGFTLIELMIVVAIIGILAAIAVSGFTKYVRRSKTVEPNLQLRKMYDAAVIYYATEHVSPGGTLLPKQWPDDTPGYFPSPIGACNQPGLKWQPNPAYWTNASLQALYFSIDDPFYYSYDWDPWGGLGVNVGEYFYVNALGDQDCNGIYSYYRRQGVLDITRSITATPIYAINPLE